MQNSNSAGPVFLLAGGGRTGSTLIQRLIISTRQVMVWGEHGGIILPQLRRLYYQTSSWIEGTGGYRMLEEFTVDTHNAWIANVNPNPSFLQAGCRAFMEQYLGTAARQMGYPRWGFKEIHYGADEVRLLKALFPRASFVFLVRNPVSCLRSIKSTPWYASDYQSDPARFLKEWARLSGSLAEVYPECQRACFLRYEDAIANPEETTKTIASAIHVPGKAFDLTVFDRRKRGLASTPAELDAADLSALQHQDVREVAGRLGYEALTPPA